MNHTAIGNSAQAEQQAATEAARLRRSHLLAQRGWGPTDLARAPRRSDETPPRGADVEHGAVGGGGAKALDTPMQRRVVGIHVGPGGTHGGSGMIRRAWEAARRKQKKQRRGSNFKGSEAVDEDENSAGEGRGEQGAAGGDEREKNYEKDNDEYDDDGDDDDDDDDDDDGANDDDYDEEQGGCMPSAAYYLRAIMFFRRRYPRVAFVYASADGASGLQWFKKHVLSRDPFKGFDCFPVAPQSFPLASAAASSVASPASFDEVQTFAILSRCDGSIFSFGAFGWMAAWLAGGPVTYSRHLLELQSSSNGNVRRRTGKTLEHARKTRRGRRNNGRASMMSNRATRRRLTQTTAAGVAPLYRASIPATPNALRREKYRREHAAAIRYEDKVTARERLQRRRRRYAIQKSHESEAAYRYDSGDQFHFPDAHVGSSTCAILEASGVGIKDHIPPHWTAI